MTDWLVPGGFLFVGHSESLIGSHQGYEYVAPAVYCRKDGDGDDDPPAARAGDG